MESGSEPVVSIVIASHREALLPNLLQVLSPKITGDIAYETIVVADYPVSPLRREFPGVVWHYLDYRSISAKRNLGVDHARGAIVAFIDDDCVPCEQWLPRAVTFLAQHPDAWAVEGHTCIQATGPESGTIREYRRLERPGYRTNNIFYRREAFLRVGGFDERFTIQREDLDLAFSVLDAGGTIMYDESIRVNHLFRHWDHWDLLKNCRNRRFDPLLYKKHPGRYREVVRSPFPPTLVLVLVLHCCTGVLLAVNAGAAIVAAIVDLCATACLAIRRLDRAHLDLSQLGRELISSVVAPLVLFGALAHGSIRFRRLLLF